MKNKNRPNTYFIDLDGTLIEHDDIYSTSQYMAPVLPGVKNLLDQLRIRGHRVIITTARCTAYKPVIEEWLRYHGLVYDQLITDLTTGTRVIINDIKPEDPDYPVAGYVIVKRNSDWATDFEDDMENLYVMD